MRSMENAPRDGTRIIVIDGDDGKPHCAQWDEFENEWFMCDGRDEDGQLSGDFTYVRKPLGWCPLPEEALEVE